MSSINKTIRRLPGFRFESGTTTREDVLPRMDIALFVGFAASGPIGIPVVLESADQFTAIFGQTLPLVWDKEKGEMISAYLAPSVRMFFRNGGKRCWVIRTARVEVVPEHPENRATYNYFALAGIGIIRFGDDDVLDIVPAFARARSKGSWSDNLRIATVTASEFFEFQDLVESEADKILRISTNVNHAINKGDLFRLDFPGSDLTLILVSDRIDNLAGASSPPASFAFGNIQSEINSRRFVWLRDLPLKDLPEPENVLIRKWTRQIGPDAEDFSSSVLETNQAVLSFKKVESGSRVGTVRTKILLEFADLHLSETPAEGDLLATKFQDKLLALQVETISSSGSESDRRTNLICAGVFICEDAVLPTSVPVIERLTFETWIKIGETQLSKLPDLAFDPSSERFWGNLPVDDDLYDFPESGKTRDIPSWTQTAEFAKSPIAGTGIGGGFYVPLFPTTLPQNYLGAVKLNGTRLQRDGLEIFDESLFLDEKLKHIGLNNLLTDAEFIRYLSPRPRRLWGVHSALAPEETTVSSAGTLPANPKYSNYSLDEATIISVPDAVQRGWFRDEESGAVLSPPKSFDPPLRPEWWRFQDCRNPQIVPVKEPLWGNFLDCDLKFVDAPENLRIKDTATLNDKFVIEWDYEVENDQLLFDLEESVSPTFEFPQIIYQNKRKRFEVSDHPSGLFYYRVRAEIDGVSSDWSEGLAIKVPAAENWRVKLLGKNEFEAPETHYSSDVLLAVQRALLRMCAARGDIFAVLDLPEHFNKDEALRYVAALKATKGQTAATEKVETFNDDEKSALSFGAVYHPWLMNRNENFEVVKNIPPGGAVSGVFAKRSATRGAWIAPANENLQNVLGLANEFRRENYLDIQEGSINLIRHEPTGFVVLDSDTLSDDLDLRQITVRRLLSLLRRLAAKHGAEYVFEPNDERFRRSVQRGFNSLLDKMFVLGAFAGTTPSTSYQVVVSEKLNNVQSTEQGRFIVELRVAPSLPLRFVSVKLINSGGRSTVSETV